MDPPRDQQRPEAGGEGRRPVRDVEVADAEYEHHGARREGGKEGNGKSGAREGNATKREEGNRKN